MVPVGQGDHIDDDRAVNPVNDEFRIDHIDPRQFDNLVLFLGGWGGIYL